MKVNQVVILHDNTRRHTSICTKEAVATMRLLFDIIRPTEPIYHPSIFWLPEGRRFAEDDELKHGMREDLRHFSITCINLMMATRWPKHVVVACHR
jgi:hypothetical protein